MQSFLRPYQPDGRKTSEDVNRAPGTGDPQTIMDGSGAKQIRRNKIVTFSFDDGVTQDRRLVALFERRGLKATFNINSGLLGKPGQLTIGGKTVSHDKIARTEVAGLYRNHEVAGHTLTHPDLTRLSDADVIRQVEEDRLALSELTGRPVVGMAYPGGGINHDDRVVGLIRRHTGMCYARTITATGRFAFPEDPLQLNPTVHASDYDRLDTLLEAFLALDGDTPALFYIWGHSYEFDMDDGWTRFENFCSRIADRPNVAYLTNAEALSRITEPGKPEKMPSTNPGRE